MSFGRNTVVSLAVDGGHRRTDDLRAGKALLHNRFPIYEDRALNLPPGDGMITPSPARVGAIAAASVLLTGCATGTLGVSPESVLASVLATIPASTTTTTGRPTPSRRRIPPSPPPSAAATRILNTAESYIGVKYVWGGNTPGEGFDCSGFTKFVLAKHRVALPRTSREQARAGRAVAPDFRSLKPGDLMLFAEPGEAISHVAIYAGEGRIIHSSSAVGGVGYTDLNAGGDWFIRYFVAARRVL